MSEHSDVKTPILKITNNVPEIQTYLQGLPKLPYHNVEPMLIGSRALDAHLPKESSERYKSDFNNRDYDLIVSSEWLSKYLVHIVLAIKSIQLTIHRAKTHLQLIIYSGAEDLYGFIPEYHFDFELLQEGLSSEIIYKLMRQEVYRYPFVYVRKQTYKQQQTYGMKTSMIIAPLEVLEAIKTSHIYWTHKFEKNIADLHNMRDILFEYPVKMKARQVKKYRKPSCNELVVKRRAEKELISEYVPASHIHMDQKADDFLEKNTSKLLVEKIIPHDDLHKLVATHPEIGPLYTQILVTPDKALCDEKKWDNLSQELRLDDVREEAMVLTVERYLLPKLSNDYKSAYIQALNKICTTIAKNWFREFAIDHYPLLLECPKDLEKITKEIYQKYLDTLRTSSSSDTSNNNNTNTNNTLFGDSSLPIAQERTKMLLAAQSLRRFREKYQKEHPDQDTYNEEWYRGESEYSETLIIEDVIICQDMKHAYVFMLKHHRDQADCSATEQWTGQIHLKYLKEAFHHQDNTVGKLLAYFKTQERVDEHYDPHDHFSGKRYNHKTRKYYDVVHGYKKYYDAVQRFQITGTDSSGGSWGDTNGHTLKMSLYSKIRSKISEMFETKFQTELDLVDEIHRPWIFDSIWMRLLCCHFNPQLKYGGNVIITEQLAKLRLMRDITSAYCLESDVMDDPKLVYELQYKWVSLYILTQRQKSYISDQRLDRAYQCSSS
jgi:hypothetical protein